MRFAAIGMVLLGCSAPEEAPYYIEPGGPGTGTGMTGQGPDAGTSSDGGLPTFAGTLCGIADPRDITSCSQRDYSMVTVQLGTETTMATSTGGFEIPEPTATSLQWRVSGPGFRSTVMPFSTRLWLPLMTTVRYEDLLAANGVQEDIGTGAIIVRVAQGLTPLPLVTVSTPSTVQPTRYDDLDPEIWGFDGTGVLGAAWIANVDVGTATLTVTPLVDDGPPQVIELPVQANSITYAAIVFP
jgi:hypothetical protein